MEVCYVGNVVNEVLNFDVVDLFEKLKNRGDVISERCVFERDCDVEYLRGFFEV